MGHGAAPWWPAHTYKLAPHCPAQATERIAFPFLKCAPPLGQLPEVVQRAIARMLRPVQFSPGGCERVVGRMQVLPMLLPSPSVVAASGHSNAL